VVENVERTRRVLRSDIDEICEKFEKILVVGNGIFNRPEPKARTAIFGQMSNEVIRLHLNKQN
jgi:hypothetical protein